MRMDKFLNKIKKELDRLFYFDNNPYCKAPVLLAGDGRSGTTWVSSIINYKNNFRCIFEPFWSRKTPICYKFRLLQYLRPENKDTYFFETAEKVLYGRVRNKWIDQYNKKLFGKRILIKDIRTNLMLKWIHTNFPRVKIILLLRHPCAVANSKIKAGWATPNLDKLFVEQEELMADFLKPFRKEIERAQGDFEKRIFSWCIQNYVPLRQFNNADIHLAFYENFCTNPRQEVKRLFCFLDEKFNDRIFDSKIICTINRPSPLAYKGSAIMSGDNLVSAWKKDIVQEQTCRAVRILKLFGLDEIYSEESIPNIYNEYNLIKSDK